MQVGLQLMDGSSQRLQMGDAEKAAVSSVQSSDPTRLTLTKGHFVRHELSYQLWKGGITWVCLWRGN